MIHVIRETARFAVQLQAYFDASAAHLVLKNLGFHALTMQHEERSKAGVPVSLGQMASGSVCQNLSIISLVFPLHVEILFY